MSSQLTSQWTSLLASIVYLEKKLEILESSTTRRSDHLLFLVLHIGSRFLNSTFLMIFCTFVVDFACKLTMKILAKIVFEDDKVLAFRDIQPQAPTHILIIPKDKDGLTGLAAAEERHCEILGRLLYTAKLVAKQEGLGDGYRIVINDGPNGCQSVYHIHVHLLSGRQMNWPPG
ncbi:unnamed protein product [Rhodiola kirilowii]